MILSFQNIRKIIVWSGGSRNHEILSPNLAKGGGAYVQYFLDIVLERDVRNQAGISDFLNFWDKKCREIQYPITWRK
jgi:hypothetical protein